MSARGRQRKDGTRVELPPHEFYATPDWCVRALLEEAALPGGNWLEPCCGDGAIIKAVNQHRHDLGQTPVSWDAADIRPDCGWPGAEIVDFLSLEPNEEQPYDCLVTNPPFSLALPFLKQSLRFAKQVVMLLRVGFVETPERNAFLRANPADLYLFSERPSFTGGGTDSATYLWARFPGAGTWRVLRHGSKPKRVRPKR